MRYKITIEYDGTHTLGWQRQLDGPSIQEYLENALSLLMPKKKEEEEASIRSAPQIPAITRLTPEVQGAGRTDAGVHALGQVAHFDLKRDIEDWKLREAINFHLREQDAPVVVLNVERVSEDFNARFSAVGRGYIYRILNRRTPPILEKDRVWWVPVPLDVEKMRQGARYLLGHHDFSSFRAAACQAKSPVKTLDKLKITRRGDEIVFEVEARSFLHHQVRNMVGTLKLVGDGHLRPEDVKTILEAKDRKAAGPTAPAGGLYLSKVMY
ncbi:MAG: tRNA pseudouridine(38-40) synthase TruA [Proteobacteria bacterium]|nr:tRNA pseudouridine(38-40) synthase TruA [Pseudomonadota bacterium]